MPSKNWMKLVQGSVNIDFGFQYLNITVVYLFLFLCGADNGNIENQMQAFEESVGLNKQEIEENEKKLLEFEGQMEEDRNEWLFFKNLRQRRPVTVDKAKVKEEMEKIKQLNRENAGSKTRRTVYLSLIGLVVVGIADVFISSPSDWRKGALLGIILVCLLSQVIYEQSVLSETGLEGKHISKEEKK
ncbi:hypothetical protein HAX54_021659 [Datura stramonium]|uniref:Uncharacterized protein n=1 Tax=Datura stramonium TaxID=4076 RepID=A0ABS8RL85_DATST|nr:hypothetical protein [Datura stramonium]